MPHAKKGAAAGDVKAVLQRFWRPEEVSRDAAYKASFREVGCLPVAGVCAAISATLTAFRQGLWHVRETVVVTTSQDSQDAYVARQCGSWCLRRCMSATTSRRWIWPTSSASAPSCPQALRCRVRWMLRQKTCDGRTTGLSTPVALISTQPCQDVLATTDPAVSCAQTSTASSARGRLRRRPARSASHRRSSPVMAARGSRATARPPRQHLLTQGKRFRQSWLCCDFGPVLTQCICTTAKQRAQFKNLTCVSAPTAAPVPVSLCTGRSLISMTAWRSARWMSLPAAVASARACIRCAKS